MSSAITTPSNSRVGFLVTYKLTDFDAKAIVQQRLRAGQGTFSGNPPREGDEYPAMIIRDHAQYDDKLKAAYESGKVSNSGRPMTWEKYLNEATVNLQVFLDGNDSFWATSRTRFDPERHGHHAVEKTLDPADPITLGNDPEWIPDAKGHWFEL